MTLLRTCLCLLAAAVVCAAALPAGAGTCRHDRADSLYTNLAKQWPYSAVGQLDTEYAMGSGVLISKRWVLTAAHCVDAEDPWMTFTINGSTYDAAQWFPHPEWDDDLEAGYDIGLVELTIDVTGISPVTRYRGTGEVGLVGTTSGYGDTGDGLTGDVYDSEGVLRAGRNVIDALGPALDCSDRVLLADFDRPGLPSDSTWGSSTPQDLEYCAGHGDSGGGLFITTTDGTYLCGITSFIEAGPLANPYEDGYNAGYGDLMAWTRVSAFNEWIESTIPNRWQATATPANYADARNWSEGTVPDINRFVIFTTSSAVTQTVSFAADVSARRLEVQKGYFWLALAGHTYSLLNGDSVVAPGSGQTASLYIAGGTLRTADFYLGRALSSTGNLYVSTGGAWVNQGSAYVGCESDGTAGGAGILDVTAGATADIYGTLRIFNTGTMGQCAVRGQASIGTIDVGGPQNAKLDVGAGGSVMADDVYVARKAGHRGNLIVRGAMTVTGTMNIGGDSVMGGDPLVQVQAGATLDVEGTLRIWKAGSTGSIPIDGTATAGELLLYGGSIGGGGSLTLNGYTSRWTGGSMDGSAANTAATYVSEWTEFTLAAGSTHRLSHRLLENAGTVVWSGSGDLQVTAGASVRNLPDATFDVRTGASLVGDGPAAAPFDNQGTFLKSAGTATATVNIPFDNTGTVDVRAGGLAFTQPVTQRAGDVLTGGEWFVRGGATLDLGGGGIVTNNGVVVLRGPGSTFVQMAGLADNQRTFSLYDGCEFATAGALANTGAITVGAGSRLVAGGRYVQTADGGTNVRGELVAAGGIVRIADGYFAINDNGALDLQTRAAIFDPGVETGGAGTLASVAWWLTQGCHDGAWDGPGIRSSAAAAEPQHLTAVGLLDNADPKSGGKTEFAGEDVGPTALLVAYTWWGDANLDGVVDANDYDVIDKNYLFTPEPDDPWFTGDFNYDGVIDANDYDRIDKAYLFQSGPLAATDPAALLPASIPAPIPASVPTPEPATLALLALGGLAALKARRKAGVAGRRTGGRAGRRYWAR